MTQNPIQGRPTQARARPLRADAARNRRALLDAAHEAFSREGVAASLDDIARSAGVGPGTLYRHFPARDDLVLEVIDDGLLSLADFADSLADDEDPVVALLRWLDAFVVQAGLYDGLARTLVGTPPATGQTEGCRRSRCAGIALITRAIDAGALRSDIDVDDVLDMAAAIAWLGEKPDRGESHRARLLSLLVEGLRPRAAG